MSIEPSLFQLHSGLWLAVSGLAIGIGLGAAAQRTGFCAMGGISDALLLGDGRRLRSWAMAIAVAILGVQVLVHVASLSLAATVPRQQGLSLTASAAGGLLFGLGMVFAGGCAFRNVVRAGSGDLVALAVLVVLGLTAAASLDGPLEAARVALMGRPERVAGETTGIAGLLTWLSPQAQASAEFGIASLIVVALLGYCLSDREFRASAEHVFGALAIGVLVTLGFLSTTLAYDELALVFQRPASATYVGPLVDTGRWIAAPLADVPRFGVSIVLGTLLGATAVARGSGTFRWSRQVDASDLARRLGGAVLMGFGGVLAGGCTIGQGVTGMASLGLGSFVTLVSLVIGGTLGVKILARWYGLDD